MIANNKNIKSSTMYIGYLILKEIKKRNINKISIYELSKVLKKNGISSSRHLTLSLSFLYSLDLIEFEEANIWVKS
jgi:hypothetical protein